MGEENQRVWMGEENQSLEKKKIFKIISFSSFKKSYLIAVLIPILPYDNGYYIQYKT